MAIEFKPATREAVSLLIGLVSGSGGGKTFSGMRLATGLAGGNRFAVIDTEAGRARHYADQFSFDHADLAPPFTPDRYIEAILAADKAGYPVIMVDSASHEWAGEGGVLDMQEADFSKRGYKEAQRMASWIKPKMAHKKMVQRLLQVRAHLILCMRAEEKVDMVKDSSGKMQIVPKKTLTGLDGWVPICAKDLPFELTLSFLLTADQPGIPKPIKLQEQHRPYFDTSKVIDEQAGKKLAEWAAGGTSAPKKAAPAAPAPEPDEPLPPPNSAIERLKADYETCESASELAELESERGELWPKIDAPAKTKLKLAANRAKSRLGA